MNPPTSCTLTWTLAATPGWGIGWKAKAIELWLKCGGTAYGMDGALAPKAPEIDPETAHFCKILKDLPADDLDNLIDRALLDLASDDLTLRRLKKRRLLLRDQITRIESEREPQRPA